MTLSNIADSVASTGKRLGFLRKNFFFLIAWPFAALVLSTIGWGALLTHLDGERHRAENEALNQATALSRTYAANLSRTVESIDQNLIHIRYEWRFSRGQMRLEHLKEASILSPTALLEIDVFDRNGLLLTSTHSSQKQVVIDDQRQFLVHKNGTVDFLYIGEPTYSRVSNRYVIPFTRRIDEADGGFGGVVKIAAVPDYLTASYDEIILGKNGFLGVIGTDGIIRVTRTGRSIYPPPLPTLLTRPDFVTESGSALLEGEEFFRDKHSRYVGWDIAQGYPLIVLVGLDQQEAMAPYSVNRAIDVHYATWATAAFAVFTLIAMAFSTRLAWRKNSMESAQASYRMATESGNEGFYIVRPIRDAKGGIVDFQIIDSNHRGAEMLRERRDELIGKKVSLLYEQSNPERLMAMLRRAMDEGFLEDEVEVPGDSPFSIRWAHVKMVRTTDTDTAITLRDISDTKAHFAELERRGNEDVLTGFPNRHWVTTCLPRAIELAAQSDAMLALLFVDLDGFKKVNDTAGHAVGDEVLRSAARRIKEAVRPHDEVVRLGGDEFLVILEQIAHKMDAAHVAERVVHAFRHSFKTSQGVHAVGTSIGISVFPDDGTDAETLLHNGDIAMYSVKTSGKGNYSFYDQKFYDALHARLQQESELRHAIEQDQFIMYYQPRVDIPTGTTCSMEALVRWMHPEKGLVGPLEFIPLAEETGLILSLGELVIDKVCTQIALWAQSGQDLVPVSINVSSRQFNEVDIAKILSASFARHHIDAKLVEVEITESSMMGNSTEISRTLSSIRELGVKLLVDDFGTGYSSLSQLQRLHFDMLKVDRAFTAELGRTERGNVFFKAIVTMAHALGMRVVAEGVENEDQIKILKSLVCDEIQGFYISKPLPPSEYQPVLPKGCFTSA